LAERGLPPAKQAVKAVRSLFLRALILFLFAIAVDVLAEERGLVSRGLEPDG
jgi:ABC-type uncharacterized transport system permease subunit